MDALFESLYDNINTQLVALNWRNFFICTAVSIVCGALVALFFSIGNKHYNTSYLFALIGAPVFITIIISIASRNVGITLSIAGVFTMIRFRSEAVNGRELTNILAMVAIGITCGCGFIAYAVITTVVVCVVNLIFNKTRLGKNNYRKQLRITIPESLDYNGMFDDIFEKYTSRCELVRVKSSGMGTLFQLTYNITEKNDAAEKEMLDEIRCRNGNLEVLCVAEEFSVREKI